MRGMLVLVLVALLALPGCRGQSDFLDVSPDVLITKANQVVTDIWVTQRQTFVSVVGTPAELPVLSDVWGMQEAGSSAEGMPWDQVAKTLLTSL